MSSESARDFLSWEHDWNTKAQQSFFSYNTNRSLSEIFYKTLAPECVSAGDNLSEAPYGSLKLLIPNF